MTPDISKLAEVDNHHKLLTPRSARLDEHRIFHMSTKGTIRRLTG